MFKFQKIQKAENYFQQGITFLRNAQYVASVEYLSAALSIYEELQNMQDIASCLINLGYVKSQLQAYEEALVLCQESLMIYRKINDKQGESTALQYIGQINRHNRNFEAAVLYLQESLVLSNELDDIEGLKGAYFDMGNIYFQLSRFELSLQHYKKSLDIAEKQDDKRIIGASTLAIAQLYHQLGYIEKSKENFNKSLKISKEGNDLIGTINSVVGLGMIYHSELNFKEAIKIYNSILNDVINTNDKKLLAIIYNNLAVFHDSNKEFDIALQYSFKALKETSIPNEEGMEDQKLNIYGVLGQIYLNLGNFDKAIESFEHQYSIASKGDELRSKMNACTNLGNIFFRKSEYARAWHHLKEALLLYNASLEQVGNNSLLKISFAETSRYLYKTVILTLHNMERHEEALKYSEESRAREINLYLNDNSKIDWNFLDIIKYCRAKNQYIIEYYVIHDATFENNKNINFFIDNIIFWIISPDGDLYSNNISLSTLWEILPKGSTNKGIDMDTILGLPKQTILNRQNIDIKQEEETKEILKNFYQYLFKPLIKNIDKEISNKILLIPHYELLLFPFNAFINETNNYLINEFSFTFGLSIQTNLVLWNSLRNEKYKPSNNFLIVGNPNMPTLNWYGILNKKLDALPGAEMESMEISKILGVKPFLRDQATKQIITERMPESTIIHFATHSLLSENQNTYDRLPGLIALCPTNVDNGILYSKDILEMDLTKVSLVVLSACETGRGMISSEGIIGLAWAFIKAGVKGIIVSLWRIDDTTSPTIMVDLYKSMVEGNQSAESLRSAMLKTIQQGEQFADWAPFIYIGESMSIK